MRFYFGQGDDVQVVALLGIESTATEEHAWDTLYGNAREAVGYPRRMRSAADEERFALAEERIDIFERLSR